MDQQFAFHDLGSVIDDGASDAVFLTEADDTAFDACLRKVGITQRNDVVADAIAAVGVVGR